LHGHGHTNMDTTRRYVTFLKIHIMCISDMRVGHVSTQHNFTIGVSMLHSSLVSGVSSCKRISLV